MFDKHFVTIHDTSLQEGQGIDHTKQTILSHDSLDAATAYAEEKLKENRNLVIAILRVELILETEQVVRRRQVLPTGNGHAPSEDRPVIRQETEPA